MTKKTEILSSCCAFGTDGTEDVQVKHEDCPIKSMVGYRERTKYLAVPIGTENPIIKECSCISFSGFEGRNTLPTCQYYQGSKKVKRDGRTKYKVLCGVLD